MIVRKTGQVAFDLIIFDCDGVLVDSEVISCRAHADTLTRHGYPITPEQVSRRFLGVSDREARLSIENETGRELPDEFEAQVKAATLRFYEGLKPIAHVAEAGHHFVVGPQILADGFDLAGGFDDENVHLKQNYSGFRARRRPQAENAPISGVAPGRAGH